MLLFGLLCVQYVAQLVEKLLCFYPKQLWLWNGKQWFVVVFETLTTSHFILARSWQRRTRSCCTAFDLVPHATDEKLLHQVQQWPLQSSGSLYPGPLPAVLPCYSPACPAAHRGPIGWGSSHPRALPGSDGTVVIPVSGANHSSSLRTASCKGVFTARTKARHTHKVRTWVSITSVYFQLVCSNWLQSYTSHHQLHCSHMRSVTKPEIF